MVYFREEQRMPVWAALAVFIFVPVLWMEAAVLRRPTSYAGTPLIAAFLCVAAAVCLQARLITEVREDFLSIRFRYLWPERRIRWSEMRLAEEVVLAGYRYGVRWVPGNMVYALGGNRAVRIELADGKAVFLGSRRAEELQAAIATRMGTQSAQIS